MPSEQSNSVVASDLRVGDVIQMMDREYWFHWCRISAIRSSSTGGTFYFDGRSERGRGCYRACRATTKIECRRS